MANREEIQRIRRCADAFSKELSRIVEEKNLIMYGGNGDPRFPNAGCDASSRLFGHFLLDQLRIETNHVECTRRDLEKTHCWLEYGDVIIDLTCCQFKNTDLELAFPYECPFVSDSQSDWHSTHWPKDDRESTNIDDRDRQDEEVLRTIVLALRTQDLC